MNNAPTISPNLSRLFWIALVPTQAGMYAVLLALAIWWGW